MALARRRRAAEPRAVEFRDASYTFAGERREVTRQAVVGGADVTEDDGGDDGDIDAYAETQYKQIDETPAAIDQFRADVQSAQFRSFIEPLPASVDAARRAILQRRAAILAAMEASSLTQSSLFSLSYAACVPDEYVREFLDSTEVSCVCAALVPALLVRRERYRLHVEEQVWRRAMADAGAVFKRAETRTLKGHLRALTPLPPAEGGWYTHERVESVHAHCVDDSTTLRVLVFQIHTSAAATAVDDGSTLDARRESDAGYYVRLVLHLVEQYEREEHNVVCFRSFAFARRM